MLVPRTPTMGFVVDLVRDDPENALAAVEWAAAEIVSADIARRDLDDDVAKSLRQRNDTVRRELVQAFVKRRRDGAPVDDVIRAAGWLTGLDYWVEHAFGEDVAKAEWDPRKHPRGKGGRFASKPVVSTGNLSTLRDMRNPRKPYVVKPNDWDSEETPYHQELGTTDSYVEQRYATQYNEVNDQVKRWRAQGLLENFTPYLRVGTKNQPRESMPLTFNEDGDINGFMGQYSFAHEVFLKPKRGARANPEVRSGMAAVNLSRPFGVSDEDAYALGSTLGEYAEGPKKTRLDSRINDYLAARSEPNPSTALFQRLSAGGKLIEMTHPVTPGIAALGTAAHIVGELGPQAEKIMGPTLRRAAYRYRGIESRPDEQTVRGVEQFAKPGVLASLSGRSYSTGAGRVVTPEAFAESVAHALYEPGRGKGGPTKIRQDATDEARIAAYYLGPDVAGRGMDRQRLRTMVQGDAATAAMLAHLPGNKESYLAERSGYPLPSHGIVIDNDGRVAYEATGYEHDHYLPFNLKHLRSLNGGQYVRTRSTGGPTGEDIYAGLMSNARQITVASRSGVFTVEFSPTFRGARRYNDKAVRMTRRYEKFLDTISGGKVEETSLRQADPEAYKRIVESVLRTHGTSNQRTTDEAIDAAVKAETYRRAKLHPDLTQRAADEVIARPEFAGRASGERFDAAVRARAKELATIQEVGPGGRTTSYATTPRTLQLDSLGYMRALQSLQASFPEYIRDVRVQRLDEWLASRNMSTAPGEKIKASVYPQPGAKDANFVGRNELMSSAGLTRHTWSEGAYSRGRGAAAETQEEAAVASGDTPAAGGAGTPGAAPPPTRTPTGEQLTAGLRAAQGDAFSPIQHLRIQSWPVMSSPVMGDADVMDVAPDLLTDPNQNKPEAWEINRNGPLMAHAWLTGNVTGTKALDRVPDVVNTKGVALKAYAVMLQAMERGWGKAGEVGVDDLPGRPVNWLDQIDRAHGLTEGVGAGTQTSLVPAAWHNGATKAAGEAWALDGEDSASEALAQQYGEAAPAMTQYAKKYATGSYQDRKDMVSSVAMMDEESATQSPGTYAKLYASARSAGLLRPDETVDDALLAQVASGTRDSAQAFADVLTQVPPRDIIERFRAGLALGRYAFVAGGAGPKGMAKRRGPGLVVEPLGSRLSDLLRAGSYT